MAEHQTIELNEDLPFQERIWRAERIGWILMGVLLLLAALGVFGAGPLSWTTVPENGGAVQVEYGRFQRASAPAGMTVRVSGAATADTPLSIELSEAFLRAYRIDAIRPEPAQWLPQDRGLRVSFETGGRDFVINFHLRAERIGYFVPTLRTGAGKPVALPVVIYP